MVYKTNIITHNGRHGQHGNDEEDNDDDDKAADNDERR
jgi:hypothetical protein